MSDHEPRRLSLLRLSLRNFKGVREFVLDPDGADASVFGDNAAGKTTLADAFSWLLFGKDSSGATSFEIKTLGEDGEPIHGLEHEVAATLLLPDGEVLELRKVYEEKWTKKRGAAEKVFDGHTTNHFVDGVPVKQSEYQEAVAQIADEEVFRLLTDPMHFPERIHWTDRRELLLEVCGDVTDEDVIASDPELEELPDIIGKRTLEDHRKVIDARRKEINRELDRIPVRIQEVERGLPEVGEDPDILRARLRKLRGKRSEAEEERSTIAAGGQVAEKRKELREVEAELLDIRTQMREGAEEGIAALRSELGDLEAEIGTKERKIAGLEAEQDQAAKELRRIDGSMEGLRERWHEVDSREFTHEAEDTCPTCGQDIPTEQLQEARGKALAAFNADKAERLEEIDAKGKERKADRERIHTGFEERAEQIQALRSERDELQEQAEQLQERIQEAKEVAPDPTDAPEYRAQLEAKEALEAEIQSLAEDTADALQEAADQVAALDAEIEAAEAALSKHEQRAAGEARMEELSAQERKLAGELEEIERQIHMAERFVRTKVELLTDRINDRFEIARFRLFNTLVNGGVEETCQVSCDGVPWDSLNTGARLNVGIDIINTLTEHYGLAPPVFLDGAESVTAIRLTRGQAIKLVVSPDDPELRVEISQKRQAQAA